MGSGSSPSIPEYVTTKATNPYASAVVDEKGNSYSLNPFLTSLNTIVEGNLPNLYNQLLNPTLDNTVSQARMDTFMSQLKENSKTMFENNVNALSEKGMLRSSAMKDMTNSMNKYQTEAISNFQNDLISDNTTDTTSIINTLLSQYLVGADLGQQAVSNASFSSNSLNSYNQWKYQQMLNNYYKNSGNSAMALSNLLNSGIQTGSALLL